MIFQHSREGVLILSNGALDTLRSFAQMAPDSLEAGGVLLGRYLRDGYDLVVDLVTTPQPGDVRTRFTFDRNDEHQKFITDAWESSSGTCNFLGDWHTHAEAYPSPSSIDIENWDRLLREDIVDDQACFFVIVGQTEIRVWEGIRKTGRIRQLALRLDPNASRAWGIG